VGDTTEKINNKSNAIEAVWAPKDPRDKLYDSEATPKQRGMSIFRILASFHPVLNVPVLFNDFFKALGWKRSIMVSVVLIAGIFCAFLY